MLAPMAPRFGTRNAHRPPNARKGPKGTGARFADSAQQRQGQHQRDPSGESDEEHCRNRFYPDPHTDGRGQFHVAIAHTLRAGIKPIALPNEPQNRVSRRGSQGGIDYAAGVHQVKCEAEAKERRQYRIGQELLLDIDDGKRDQPGNECGRRERLWA